MNIFNNKPDATEKKVLFREYNKGGAVALCHGAMFLITYRLLVYAYIYIVSGLSGETVENIKKLFSGAVSTDERMGLNLISYLVFYPILFVICEKISGFSVKGFFNGFKKKEMPQYLLIGFGCQGIGSLVSFIVVLIGMALSVKLSPAGVAEMPSNPFLMLMDIILAGVLAPICEEIIFRGYVLKSFSKVSPLLGLVVSSVFFGLMHGNLPQAAGAIVFGFGMGIIAYRCGSIVPTIIIHSCVNFFALAANSLSSIDGFLVAGGMIRMGLFILLGAGMIILFIVKKGWFTPFAPNPQSKGRGFAIAGITPFFLLSIAYYIYDIVSGIISLSKT